MGRLTNLKPTLNVLRPQVAFIPQDEKERAVDRSTLPWRKWYNLARWRKLRMAAFIRDLFQCQLCHRIEPDTSKLVADHIKPHKGDPVLFWNPVNVQTLCIPCHNSVKQAEERRAR